VPDLSAKAINLRKMSRAKGGRTNYRRGGSRFYRELLGVLDRLERDQGRKITYRQAVVEGMELQDSFTGRLKHATYIPTLDRFQMLAKYLEVPPTTFSDYAIRFARQELEKPTVLAIFEALAKLPERQLDKAEKELRAYAERLAGRA
jgi:hypothetical protein